MIRIIRTNSNFERERLISPFGFKGGYIDELWQTAAGMMDESGRWSVGLGTQSILWSDPGVFNSFSRASGNGLMFLMTEYALKEAVKQPFDSPVELLENLLPKVLSYGMQITGHSGLRTTFALNSLVPVDNAAWLLYAHKNKIRDFDGLIPAGALPGLRCRHRQLAVIPLVTYDTSLEEVARLLDEGCSVLKIKIGADPDQDGDRDKMLAWDMQRLSEIHSLAAHRDTPLAADGHIQYYLDANGRYDGKDRLMKLLDHADKIGALDRILLLEEPFSEECKTVVADIPVRVAAGESAHTDADALERIELGYGAIALKPAAKTLSMSFKIVRTAHDLSIPCFCADLTVNPILVDWNKNVAARMEPVPGMKTGLLESNGGQNYMRWKEMKQFHPVYGSGWIDPKNGAFDLDDDFYLKSGGIFQPSGHYDHLAGIARHDRQNI